MVHVLMQNLLSKVVLKYLSFESKILRTSEADNRHPSFMSHHIKVYFEINDNIESKVQNVSIRPMMNPWTFQLIHG
jgi:hypothetical protein